MNSKKAGFLFFTQIVLAIGASLYLNMGNPNFELPILLNLILSESMILVPALLFLIGTRTSPDKLIHFRKIRISTVFLILLFTALMSPLITAVNAFTMIFTDNTVMEVSTQVLEKPYPIIVFLIGFFGPFCEEFAFRGVLFGSFRRTGRILGAALLQALLFGMMHLNFNQFCYAFVIGIALAVLVEATDSFWSGFIMHAAINATNVTMMYLMKPVLLKMNEAMGESIYDTKSMVTAMCVYLVLSMFTTSIAVCVLVWIAKNEQGTERLQAMFTKREKVPTEQMMFYEEKKKPEQLIYAVTVIAMAVCAGYMLLVEILKKISTL